MARDLPQHPSSHPGGPECLGERCSLCRGSTGQSTFLAVNCPDDYTKVIEANVVSLFHWAFVSPKFRLMQD